MIIIHTTEDLAIGEVVDASDGIIWMKGEGYVFCPPFQVLEKVTKEEYLKFVKEYYGEEFLPSPGLETFNFYRVSMD